MVDIFEDRSGGLESPAYRAFPVTPSDSTDLAMASRALYLGTGGDLRVTMASGDAVTFRNAAPGILPVRAERVHATGTTATDIVVLL